MLHKLFSLSQKKKKNEKKIMKSKVMALYACIDRCMLSEL